MSDGTNAPARRNDPLRVLAEALAPYLREQLGHAHPESEPVFYSQHDSPLGRRRHLELVRSGVLAGRKVRRLVLVRRDEVHAFIERHRPLEPLKDDEDKDDGDGHDNDLADWGLLPRRGRR